MIAANLAWPKAGMPDLHQIPETFCRFFRNIS